MDFSRYSRLNEIFDIIDNNQAKDDLKVEAKVADKGILQGLAETALNFYSKEMIISALDFIASLSEDDLKEWTRDMSPEDTARVYGVWRATQPTTQIATQMGATAGLP